MKVVTVLLAIDADDTHGVLQAGPVGRRPSSAFLAEHAGPVSLQEPVPPYEFYDCCGACGSGWPCLRAGESKWFPVGDRFNRPKVGGPVALALVWEGRRCRPGHDRAVELLAKWHDVNALTWVWYFDPDTEMWTLRAWFDDAWSWSEFVPVDDHACNPDPLHGDMVLTTALARCGFGKDIHIDDEGTVHHAG